MSSAGALGRVALLTLRHGAAGYGRGSLLALTALVVAGAAVGYRWSDLLDANGVIDPLLLGTWALLALLVTWRPSLGRDLRMLFVGLCGGSFIEWWGTQTQLWTYFTLERPPLWILPAWPIAALAIDRGALLLDFMLKTWHEQRGAGREPTQLRWAYWLLVPGFVLLMSRFAWPSAHLLATRAVIALMLTLTLRVRSTRLDTLAFLSGAALGVLLETWGTTRQCWTYYTGQTPPLEAVLAHGFAALAFRRAAALLEHGWRSLRAWAAQRQSLKA